MADLDGVVRIGTEIDDSGFIKGIQKINKTAESNLEPVEKKFNKIEESIESVGETSKKASENIKDVGDSSKGVGDTVGKEFEGAKASAEDFAKAAENVAKVLQSKYDVAQNKVAELTLELNKSVSKTGAASKESQNLASALSKAEKELSSIKSELDKASKNSNEFADELDDAGKEAKQFANEIDDANGKVSKFTSFLSTGFGAAGGLAAKGIGVFAGAATATIGSLLALESATEEYRIAMGKLNTAFETSAVGVENAKGIYNGFYQILGETDTATEASQLLARLAGNTQEAATWIEIAAGVYGTFGDSLPIESMIEAANETAKVGTVTGTLADALNWVGISEDEFNKKLAACNSESERANLIMTTLSETYQDASDAFYANNDALISARMAQIQMDNALAGLGETVSKVKTNLMGEFLPVLAEVTTAFSDVLSGTEGADEEFSESIGNLVESAVERLPDFLDFGVQIVASLVNGILENLPALIETIPEIFTSITTAISEIFPTLLSVGAEILQQIVNGIMENDGILSDGFSSFIEKALEFLLEFSGSIRENAGLLVDAALVLVQNLANGIIQNIPTIIETIPTIITNIAGIINDNAPKLIATAASIIANLAVGLVKAIPTLVKNIPQIIEAIVNVFLAFNWINLGKNVITALKDGITSMVASVKTAASNIVSNINGTIAKLPAALKASGSNAIQSLINGIKSLIGAVGGAIKTIATTIINGVKNLPSQFLEFGKNIIQGLINGVKNKIGDVGSVFTSLGSSIINKTADVLGINSPSRVFRDFIGKNIILGLIEGVNALGEKVVIAITKPVEDAAKKIKNVGLSKNMTSVISQAIEKSKTEAKSYSDVGDILTEALQTSIDDNKEETIEKIQSLIDESLEAIKDDDEKAKAKEAADELMTAYKEALEDGAEKAKQYVSESISSITEEFQNQYDDLISKQQALEENLGGEYLFEVQDGEVFIEDLENSIDVLNRYQEALTSLQEKGASQDLIDQIGTYEPEEGLAIMENLLKMSDDDFTEFQENWAEKKELARQIAEQTYSDQLTELKEGFIDEMMTTLEKVPDDTFDIGVDSMQGWIDGMNNKLPDLEAKARDIARKVIAAMKSEMGIESPSKEGIYIGEMMNAGVAKGLDNSVDIVDKSIAKLGFFDAVKASIPQMQSAVMSAMSAMVPAPVYAMGGNTSNVNNYSNPFNLYVDKIINSGSGTTEQFFEDAAFYTKVHSRQKGGK